MITGGCVNGLPRFMGSEIYLSNDLRCADMAQSARPAGSCFCAGKPMKLVWEKR